MGSGLVRPECVLATRGGDLFASDWRGGVAHIRPDGSQALYVGASADLDGPPRPNGIALEPDGAFLLAHLGEREGGVLRLERSGRLTPWLREVDGEPLPPTNYVTRDRLGRVWVSVSTRQRPRSRGYRRDVADGFIVLADGSGARIVADGLGYANECAVSPDGRWLYVNETFARRLSRFPLRAHHGLGDAQIVAELGPGEFPDGLAFDADGAVWIACVIGNRLLKVADGAVTTWLDAADSEHVAAVESAYLSGTMGPEHMSRGRSVLPNITSIAFGGPQLRTAYLGSLEGRNVLALAGLQVAGAPPVHWECD